MAALDRSKEALKMSFDMVEGLQEMLPVRKPLSQRYPSTGLNKGEANKSPLSARENLQNNIRLSLEFEEGRKQLDQQVAFA